jgi:hypothetical protein
MISLGGAEFTSKAFYFFIQKGKKTLSPQLSQARDFTMCR